MSPQMSQIPQIETRIQDSAGKGCLLSMGFNGGACGGPMRDGSAPTCVICGPSVPSVVPLLILKS